jgi:putative tryptophan/tyrosine transport system substrate-binding protein
LNRRKLITASLAFGALAPWRARAQSKTKTLGVLSPGSAISLEQRLRSPFYVRLKELGWVEGQNLAVEGRYADGDEMRLPALALELVERRVDVIWAFGPEAAVAAAQATKAIPIVFWPINYPIELGLADSFARPGRNVTGIAFFAGVGVSTKLFEFLRDLAPAARRVAGIASLTGLRSVSGKQFTGSLGAIESAAGSLGLQYRLHHARTPQEFDAAFASIVEWRADALVVWAVPATVRETPRIVEFASQHRLPCACQLKEQVQQGALVSYGPDVPGTLAQSAVYVDRVLRGAKPGDLPIELPSKYELAVNMKTAKALGLAVKPSFLARADHVFQ